MSWQIFASQGYVVRRRQSARQLGPRRSVRDSDLRGLGQQGHGGRARARSTTSCKQGIADPDRLGVGGWSYGGILTNFVIAKDTRFKSATSGASISNVLAGYGTDMYVREYETELGTPWKNLDVWLRNSYPFLHADRIKTPTLFLCGDQRFQRAAAELGADVPGAAQPGRATRSW